MISLTTRPRDEQELVGLVDSLTERPSEQHVPGICDRGRWEWLCFAWL